MEKILPVAIAIILICQVAEALETHTRLHHTSLPINDNGSWYYERDHFIYSNVECVSSQRTDFIRATVVKDLFSNYSQAYNCTHEYSNGNSCNYDITSKMIEDKFFVSIGTHLQDLKTKKWKILMFDLPSCNVITTKFPIWADDLELSSRFGEILFKNSTICGKKHCKMTLDLQLNSLEGPEAWIDTFAGHLDEIEIESSNQTDKMNLLRQHNSSAEQISLITKKGSKFLIENEVTSPSQLSIAHEIISVMSNRTKLQLPLYATRGYESKDMRFRIQRFDLEGNMKMQKDILIYELIRYGKIHNLKDGSFLFIFGRKLESELKLLVMKYSGDGEYITNRAIHGFLPVVRYPTLTSSVFNDIMLYMNADKMICFIQGQESQTRMCGDIKCIDAFETCFREEDLKS